MFREFFEALKVELMGVIPDVRIGIPKDDKNNSLKDVTVYINYINIENYDRLRGMSVIRVLITVFTPDSKGDADEYEVNHLLALDAIDEIFLYLEENKRSYNLVATPENITNNIWSAFKIPLRPFLVYECPISLASNS